MANNVFLTTNPGLEKGLKEEVKLRFPAWRGAYSAPGFLTYATEKEYSAAELADIPFIFARLRGPVLGKLTLEEAQGRSGLTLAVRDLDPVPTTPMDGEEVDILIRIDEGHALHARCRPGPWTFTPFEQPPEAPSRAYLKFMEACAFAGTAPRPGERALELGSSPGGASYALLKMGVDTMGVDTAPMHDSCLKFPGPARFKHLDRPMQRLQPKDLGPTPFQWLVCDVNLRPRETWESLERLIGIMAPKHLVWTMKMTNWEKIGEFLERSWPGLEKSVRASGAKSFKTAFLPSHNREFLVWVDY